MVYVKVIDGLIVEGPKEVSSNESDSPNVHWGSEQLKLNNIFFVDIDHDPLSEKIDYANPVITKESVTYSRISLSASEVITVSNDSATKKRLLEYPTFEEKLNALWEYIANNDQSSLNNLNNRINQINNKYPIK